jgi:hypothetical protein
MAKTPNTEQRKQLAAEGKARPDGSYPIQDAADVEDAVTAYNLSSKKTSLDKAWIIKRAKELNATDKLPDKWLKHSDMSEFLYGVLTSDEATTLEHHGVKGMHWGIRKDRTASLTIRHPSTGELHTIHYNPKRLRVETNEKGEKTLSGDRKEVEHVQRSAANALAKKPGKAKRVEAVPLHPERKASTLAESKNKMSDEELRQRLNRLKMEQEYAKLTAPPESTGKKIKKGATKAVGNAAQSTAESALKAIGGHAVNQLVLPAATSAITNAALKAAARKAARSALG